MSGGHEQSDSNPIHIYSMDPDTQLEQANQQQALGLAMARLPERQRSARTRLLPRVLQ